MTILILGSGGREHTFAWKIAQSPLCETLYVAPGNSGTAQIATNINIGVTDFPAIKELVISKQIDMVVVGPEDPLVLGIHDYFLNDDQLKHIAVIGPQKAAATLEGSKEFAKEFLFRHHIPTAAYKSFNSGNVEEGFKFLETLNPPYVLKAAGSGITPILSIIKCALEEEIHSKVILVYGNKTTQDTMFLNELLELQHQYSNRFSIQFVFSQADEEHAVFGRIEKSTVNFVMKNKYKHIDVDAYYICGPEEMIHTVKDVLTEHGIASDRIHFELFKAAKQTDDSIVESVQSGKTKVTIMLDDEKFTFEMTAAQSVLEAALDANLDAPYSCQGGICSSCLARLKEGKVKMRQNNILTDSEVAEGLILTCQSHPLTPTIYVDYDDI